MWTETPAIVLAIVKYNDTDAVIKTFTAETGFTAFYIKGFFKGKKARQKKALFQPNNLLEIGFQFRNKDKLEHIKEASVLYHYKDMPFDFDKLNVSTFMREVLLEALKNEQANRPLFDFIKRSFQDLDQMSFYPDFHIFFLFKLTTFLGFFPDLNTEGQYFDMENAVFSNTLTSGTFLDKQETILLKRVSGMIFATKKSVKLNQNDRQKLIEILLRYYQLHIARFQMPKSVTVLNRIYE